MADNDNDLLDESHDEDSSNSGSPATANDEFKPPKDGSWVPRERLNAVFRQLNELRGELQALKAPPAPKVALTKAQLRAAVSEGTISEEEAEALWERQTEERIAERITSELAAFNRKSSAARTIAEYETIEPDLVVEGSPLREKVISEYRNLLDLGSPDIEATMVAALRTVCGSVDSFRRAKAGRKGRVLESHDDFAGGGDDPEAGSPAGKGKLSKSERDYYAPLIQRGMYRDWKEVEDMVSKYGTPRLRKLRGA